MLDVITHSGQFHADEVVATALLEVLHGEPARVTRTRSAHVIDAAPPTTYVIDVGGVYDPARRRFDHHQREPVPHFDEAMPEISAYPFRMSSCGLVWSEYGEMIVKGLGASPDTAEAAVETAYDNFFAAIDAHDNGVPYVVGNPDRNYAQPLHLSYCLGLFNNQMDQDVAFVAAVGHAKTLVLLYLNRMIAKVAEFASESDRLHEALVGAFEDPDNQGCLVLDFPSRCVNEYLRRADPRQHIKTIVLPSGDDSGTWRVHTVDYHHRRFATYAPIAPVPAHLEPRIQFVHNNLFMAVALDREAAIELAELTLTHYFRLGNTAHRVWRWMST